MSFNAVNALSISSFIITKSYFLKWATSFLAFCSLFSIADLESDFLLFNRSLNSEKLGGRINIEVLANTSIFILPPSFSELSERLNRRKSDSKSAIEKRLQNAKKEVAHFKKYDFVIINDDIDNALTALKDIFFSKSSNVDEDLIQKILKDMLY